MRLIERIELIMRDILFHYCNRGSLPESGFFNYICSTSV